MVCPPSFNSQLLPAGRDPAPGPGVLMMVVSSDLLSRARGEYLEMPGLSLTVPQAQRLWGLDNTACRQVLQGLIEAGFLKRRSDGTYVRRTTGTIEYLPTFGRDRHSSSA